MKNIAMIAAMISSSAFGAEYIVKLKDNTKALSSIKGAKVLRELDTSFGSFTVIESDDSGIIERSNLHSNIEYIEPNFKYMAFNAPSDDKFKKQWGLHNDGKNSGSWWSRGVAGVDISAVKAWGVTKGISEVKIAVIDTGVDYTHEDLKNNIMVNDLELHGQAGVDDDGNGYVDDIYGYDFANDDADPMDGHGHGTHCAGVIGAEHNGRGIVGVMANVKILPIKFLTDKGGGTLEAALKSINYAIDRGVHVMSNSWGGGGFSKALLAGIKMAKAKGIIFTAAAGNSRNNNDTSPSYPASYEEENIISIGALDGKGGPASFSNYGKESVHVFAPGVDILSTVPNNKYKEMTGTSMACPHVSGVVGLLLSHSPNLDYNEVKQRLMSTAIKTPELDNYTASGYVDAYEALMY